MSDDRFGPDVTLDRPAFIHDTALVYGKVSIGEGSSLWPYSVIRAEMFDVEIGRFSNIQDGAVIHVGGDGGTKIGDYCSITHQTTIHGAEIGDNTLVGINATVMDGAKIGRNCIIAGGAFVTERAVIPDNSIVMGTPGKVVRTMNNFRQTRRNAMIYWRNAVAFAEGNHRGWSGPAFEAWYERMLADVEADFRRDYPEEAAD